MKKTKVFGRYAVLFFALLLLIVGGILTIHASRSQGQATQKISLYLVEHAEQQAAAVRGRLREQLVGISALASFMAMQPQFSVRDNLDMLRNRSVSKYYKRLGIITADGDALYTDDSPFQPNQRQVFLRAMQGRSSISTPLQDDTDGTMITMMAAPIFRSGVVIGVFAAHFPGGFFQPEVRSTLLGGQTLTFLMDVHGFVLDRTLAPIPGEETNFLLYISKISQDFSKSPQLLADDLRAGKRGVESYTTGGSLQHVAYSPVGEAGWYVMTLLPERALVEVRREGRLPLEFGLALLLAGTLLCVPAIFSVLTLRKAVLRVTVQAEQRLAALTECMSGGFLCCSTERNMRVVDISHGLLQLMGFTREEFFAHCKGDYLLCVMEEDRPCLTNALASTRDNAVCTDYRLKRKDGSALWVQDRRRTAFEEGQMLWYCAIVDSTERMLLLEERVRAKNHFVALMDVADGYLFSCQIQNGAVSASGALHVEYNIHEPPFALSAAQDDLLQIHFEDRESYTVLRQRVLAGAPGQAVLRIRNLRGDYHWNTLRLRPVDGRQAANFYVVGSLSPVYESQEQSNKVETCAQYDVLTGLLTQESMRRAVNAYVTRGETRGQEAICLVDIDAFRQLKKRCGFEITENLIKELANTLRGAFRPMDLLGRVGHDQFPIFVRDFEDRQWLFAQIDQVRLFAAKGVQIGDETVNFSFSVGIAFFPAHGNNFDRLLHNADSALSAAKKSGPGSLVVYGEK